MTDTLVQALHLRTWAIRVLSTGWTTPPDVDGKAWRLFLRAERCAVALSTRAEGDAPPILHAAATIELQRILSARAQIEDLGRSAAAAGLRVMVLKGSLLALTSGHAVDLDDVDVLAEPGREKAIAAFLDGAGYGTVGTGTPVHLAGRVTPTAVPVEVHVSIRELGPVDALWGSARVLEGHPGLWRLEPAKHARHVLLHVVKTHPYRRSVLRDLLVIGEADRQLTAQERADLDRDALSKTLEMARALAAGALEEDPLATDAAAHYLLASSPIDRWLGGHVSRRVFSPESFWRDTWTVEGVSPRAALERIERVSPRSGNWLRRVLRLARAPLVILAAAPTVRRARRAAAQASHTSRTRVSDVEAL